MNEDVGRVQQAEPGSRASTEPANGLGPAGFDPSREKDRPKLILPEMSIVERVSRALFRQEFAESPAVLPYEDDEWPGFVDIAAAAIVAVRAHDREANP